LHRVLALQIYFQGVHIGLNIAPFHFVFNAIKDEVYIVESDAEGAVFNINPLDWQETVNLDKSQEVG
jgi:hypothetical protein